MIAPNVSRRYAKALLEIGLEASAVEPLVRELDSAAGAYAASADLRAALDNPLVPIAAKKAMLADVAAALALGPTVRNTMMMLCERRRLRILPEVALFLREMSDLRAGVVHAEVTTSIAMSDAYYERLRLLLEKMTGRSVLLDKKIDPTMIGGVTTRIGDRIIDGSIRARLQSLKSALMPN